MYHDHDDEPIEMVLGNRSLGGRASGYRLGVFPAQAHSEGMI